MYVCICNAITDQQIRAAREAGVRDLSALQETLGVAAGCGSCRHVASKILAEGQSGGFAQTVSYQPAIA